MKRVLAILVGLFLVSCNEQAEVSWPSLTELDNLSILVEHAADAHKHGEQKAMLVQAKGLINDVVSSVPNNVHHPEEVAVLLKDLQALTSDIDKLESLGHNELDALSYAIHPIVAQVMKSAGVPHVHAKEEGKENGKECSGCNDPSHNHDH